MNGKQEKNGKDGAAYVPLVVAILGAFGGGFGANHIWVRSYTAEMQEMARPDPFTGTQGRELERRLSQIAGEVGLIRQSVPTDLNARLAIVEREIKALSDDVKELQGEHKAPKR